MGCFSGGFRRVVSDLALCPSPLSCQWFLHAVTGVGGVSVVSLVPYPIALHVLIPPVLAPSLGLVLLCPNPSNPAASLWSSAFLPSSVI